jgi:hypothetical protein
MKREKKSSHKKAQKTQKENLKKQKPLKEGDPVSPGLLFENEKVMCSYLLNPRRGKGIV